MSFTDKINVHRLPGEWKKPGNPTTEELTKTFRTVKKILGLNKEALETDNCDYLICKRNIRLCVCMMHVLYDYLEET